MATNNLLELAIIRKVQGLNNIEKYCKSELFENRIDGAINEVKKEMKEISLSINQELIWNIDRESLKTAVKQEMVQSILDSKSVDVADEDILDMLAIWAAKNIAVDLSVKSTIANISTSNLKELVKKLQ